MRVYLVWATDTETYGLRPDPDLLHVCMLQSAAESHLVKLADEHDRQCGKGDDAVRTFVDGHLVLIETVYVDWSIQEREVEA